MAMEQRKNESRKRFDLMCMKLAHLGLSVLLFYVFWLWYRFGRLTDLPHYGFRYNYYVALGYGVVLFFFLRTYNGYLLGYTRIRALIFAQGLSQFFSAGIMWFIVCVAWKKWNAPWIFFGMLTIQLALDTVWSYFANALYFRLYPVKRTILIYRNELDKKRFGTLRGKPSERLYRIDEEFCYDGYSFKSIRHKLEGYDAVFVAGVHSRCRNGIAKYCKEEGIVGFFLPHIGDVIMQEAIHIKSFDAPVLTVTRSELNPEYAIIKRAFDIVSSGAALVILSPILLITAAAIHFYDGGPAIYKQVRLTQNGREFTIYKFRSMRVDAEKDGVARLSTGDKDDRITPIGRFVRKCRLDELPQLWNILKGDMSVVGPRPERPEIAKKYYEFLPDFQLRLQVKAGLTGYAQVYGKYNTDPYEKLEFDLMYINNMSIITDLQLMFATFGILFSKESTQGVEFGQLTAAGGTSDIQQAEVVDYDDEKLRAESAEEIAKQWEQ